VRKSAQPLGVDRTARQNTAYGRVTASLQIGQTVSEGGRPVSTKNPKPPTAQKREGSLGPPACEELRIVLAKKKKKGRGVPAKSRFARESHCLGGARSKKWSDQLGKMNERRKAAGRGASHTGRSSPQRQRGGGRVSEEHAKKKLLRGRKSRYRG